MVRFLDLGFACSSLDAQDRYKIMSNDALAQNYAVADSTDLSPLPHRPLKIVSKSFSLTSRHEAYSSLSCTENWNSDHACLLANECKAYIVIVVLSSV